MVKEHAAYDNLPAKQSRWEILSITPATFLESFKRPSDKPPALSWHLLDDALYSN
jgi:hypothetical protein